VYGPEPARNQVFPGMMYGSKRMAEADTRGGIEPRYMQGILPTPARFEVRTHRGESILLSWYAHTDGEAVRAVTRVETDGDRLARVQNYFFTPDFIADLCRELDVPFRLNGYRSWLRGC
jgi:RNA polymerase sigma-70 factor (ECF subfamily)